MRKLLYALLLLSSSLLPLCARAQHARAQSAAPDSVRLTLDQLFAHVDKTQVPTPFLEEYGHRFLPLDAFAGTRTDSSLMTMQAWRLLYATVFSGNCQATNPLPALATINQTLAARLAASPVIPLAVQRINYAALRPDALTAGLFTEQNQQLYDVPGRAQSPYLFRTLFAGVVPCNGALIPPTGLMV